MSQSVYNMEINMFEHGYESRLVMNLCNFGGSRTAPRSVATCRPPASLPRPATHAWASWESQDPVEGDASVDRVGRDRHLS